MHSSVFCLTAYKKEIKDIYKASLDMEIVESIGADYATEREDFDAFKKDVGWFSSFYKCSYSIEDFTYENSKIKVAKISVEELKKGLKREKNQRLELIKKELEKEDPDLFTIAYHAYLEKGFYFWAPGYGIEPAVFLDNYLKANESEYIYIVKTYDYHF